MNAVLCVSIPYTARCNV